MLIQSFFHDFYRFHRWANRKLFDLTKGLDEAALNASMPLGPGSLRATIIHNIAAQRVWLDRWQGHPSPRFPDGDPWSLDQIEHEQSAIDDELMSFIQSRSDELLETTVSYQNLKGDRFEHRLSDLLLHVFNHAVHHRAQALHFLKRQGRLVRGGLDYIFFRIAHPTVLLDADVAKGCQDFGLEVGNSVEAYQPVSLNMLRRYQSYTDWATQRLLHQSTQLTPEQVDHDWGMGQGTFRKTLLHLYDAERWWQNNWKGESLPFPRSDINTPMVELVELWQDMMVNRSEIVESTGHDGMEGVVGADFGSGPLRFRVSESMLQLCVHGTLHRAQANNMLRNLDLRVLPLDFVVYLRECE